MATATPEPSARLFAGNSPLPAWPLRDQCGQPTDLYTLCEGQTSVVLHIARPDSPGARQAIKRLADLGAEHTPPPLRVALLPADTGGDKVLALAHEGITLAVLQTAQPGGDGKQMAWAVCDKAAKIRHTGYVRPGELGKLAAVLKRAVATSVESTGSPRSESAPILMVPGVLDKNLCKRLIAHFEKSQSHPSGVLDLSGPQPQWRPDPAVKQRRDLRLEDPALMRELEQAVAARVLPEIRKCFHYVVTHHEAFKLVRYDTGSGYFRPHRDNETPDTDYRRFAMTINLNTGDYDGGALEFPEFGSALYRPPLGGAIVFSCSLLHEATDVTRGSRYAVLGFFYNPDEGRSPDNG